MPVTETGKSVDLKLLAHELLHEAQLELQQEGHLTPTAVAITPAENLIFEIEYDGDEEREELYSQVADVAMEKKALAILTVNDIYLDESGPAIHLEGSGWEKLEQPAPEAIMIVVSGGGFESWTLTAPYFRRAGEILFQPAEEKGVPGAEVELLGDWTGRTGAA